MLNYSYSKKQKLYNEIETLPDEFANQVINFIVYLKLSCIDIEAPESITIKRKIKRYFKCLVIHLQDFGVPFTRLT